MNTRDKLLIAEAALKEVARVAEKLSPVTVRVRFIQDEVKDALERIADAQYGKDTSKPTQTARRHQKKTKLCDYHRDSLGWDQCSEGQECAMSEK